MFLLQSAGSFAENPKAPTTSQQEGDWRRIEAPVQVLRSLDKNRGPQLRITLRIPELRIGIEVPIYEPHSTVTHAHKPTHRWTHTDAHVAPLLPLLPRYPLSSSFTPLRCGRSLFPPPVAPPLSLLLLFSTPPPYLPISHPGTSTEFPFRSPPHCRTVGCHLL